MLEACLRAQDRADALAAVLEKEGMTVTSTRSGVVHVHPLVRVEQAERALFVKLAKLLGLHWAAYVDGGDVW
jgi:phage terminase small subunit